MGEGGEGLGSEREREREREIGEREIGQWGVGAPYSWLLYGSKLNILHTHRPFFRDKYVETHARAFTYNIYLSYLSIYPCLSLHIIWIFSYLSIDRSHSVHIYIRLFISIYLLVCLYICLSCYIYLSIYLSQSIHICNCPFISIC